MERLDCNPRAALILESLVSSLISLNILTPDIVLKAADKVVVWDLAEIRVPIVCVVPAVGVVPAVSIVREERPVDKTFCRLKAESRVAFLLFGGGAFGALRGWTCIDSPKVDAELSKLEDGAILMGSIA